MADRLTRPLVALGTRLMSDRTDGARAGLTSVHSFLLGVATGLSVGALRRADPGPGPDGRGDQGASAHTTLLLLAYAAGAATSLAVALLVGGRRVRRHEAIAGRGRVDAPRRWASLCWSASPPSRLGLDTEPC